ncbi:lysosome membrane protein 2-like [Athalia rosae]|uniref:lysosome membrane protein 2-like n=1 Tax=Athalia rosae TaxID=37344 RepID=UPI00203484CB|nr:lysosome membrane protein 2-like [Athalia rosae]
MKDQFILNPAVFDVKTMKKERSKLSNILLIFFFVLTTIASFSLVIVFWFTSVFDNAILSQLVLKNGTQSFSWWENPPVTPLIRVMVFNYTNLEEYRLGKAAKLHVEELGPYIYKETLKRVNVEIHENGRTLSYQEYTTHEWVGGRPDSEIICVPNLPLMTAVKKSKGINFLAHLGITVTLGFMQAEPFKVLTVEKYLWGYHDHLVDTVHDVLAVTGPITPAETFGMLMGRSGLSKDRITIQTGSDDINHLGLVEELNGVKKLDVWDDEVCDGINGTDGSMFPPNLVRDPRAKLNIYTRDMCRNFPLEFYGYGSSFGIPSLRYKPSKDIFTATREKNSCFCQKSLDGKKIESCPPVGVFNASACNFGAPVLLSFPHFYGGEKSLLNHVTGLNPKKELHETWADIHPRLGVLIGGLSRLQINVQVNVVRTIPVLEPLKDGMILPVLWLEIGIDTIPDQILGMLKHAYFTASAVECGLQWGSVICTLLSMFAAAYMVRKYKRTNCVSSLKFQIQKNLIVESQQCKR